MEVVFGRTSDPKKRRRGGNKKERRVESTINTT